MKDDSQNLIAFLVTLFIFICLVIIFSCTTVGGKHDTPNTDTTEVCKHWQDTTPWYDSAFVYEMKNYRVDVLYSSRKNEIRLIFRNHKEPDMFNVYITPVTPDFETYKGDICSRFIDVHEANLSRAYEYYTEYRNGQVVQCMTHSQDIPIIDEFNVRLIKRQNASTGQLETFIVRNKTREEKSFWDCEMQL
jgi:hypothetical protein